MHNLVVELDERYDPARVAEEKTRLESAGYSVAVHHSAPDRVLAWIDEEFGGAWSGEAYRGSNVVVSKDDRPVAFATVDPRGLRYAWLRGLASEPGFGVFGPFGVTREERGGILGESVLALALCELRALRYHRAVIAAVGDPSLVAYYAHHANAQKAEIFEPMAFVVRPPRTLILASGSGTNAQSVIDRVREGLPLDLRAVISNKASAFVLERARNASIASEAVVWDRASQSRAQYDEHLLTRVAAYQPELILLLGWMHLLDARFVDAFPQLINIHPAFLPHDSSRDVVGMPDGTDIRAYRGAHAVADALKESSRWVGATAHAVTIETDRGPVLARKPLHVSEGEDERSVLARLHPIEHQVVESAIRRWLFER